MSKQVIPLSVEQSDIDFINRTGVGKNFSAKARDIFRKAQKVLDVLVVYEGTTLKSAQNGAVLAYEANEDGEKSWGALPFAYAKKAGYSGLKAAAGAHGYLCQIVTVPEVGFVAVWLAPPANVKDCASCLERIKNAILG